MSKHSIRSGGSSGSDLAQLLEPRCAAGACAPVGGVLLEGQLGVLRGELLQPPFPRHAGRANLDLGAAQLGEARRARRWARCRPATRRSAADARGVALRSTRGRTARVGRGRACRVVLQIENCAYPRGGRRGATRPATAVRSPLAAIPIYVHGANRPLVGGWRSTRCLTPQRRFRYRAASSNRSPRRPSCFFCSLAEHWFRVSRGRTR